MIDVHAWSACRTYGNSISGFFLTMFKHPKWIVIILNLVTMGQLLVSDQVGFHLGVLPSPGLSSALMLS